jgi:hypothetical protein
LSRIQNSHIANLTNPSGILLRLKSVKTTTESKIHFNNLEPETNECRYLITVREPTKIVSEKVEYLKQIALMYLEQIIRIEMLKRFVEKHK